MTGNQRLYRWAHQIPTIIGRLSAFFWGVYVEVSGREHFNDNQQYIFVGNHRSMLDAIISGGFIVNPKKYIGKAEILKWPFMGYMLRRMYIPVKRDSKESRIWSKEQLVLKMKEGYSMIIFAEGKTNSSHEAFLPFKDGAFTTSCEMQIPIVPFVIYGADKLWHRTIWLIRPGKVYLKLLPVIHPMENSLENIEKLKNKCYDMMLENYLMFSQKEKAK